MKKVILRLFALSLCLPLCACGGQAADHSPEPTRSGAADVPFTDVPADADYAEAVAWCHEKGILKGISDTTFEPDTSLSRAMLVTALYRAAGEPAVSGAPGFTDTRAGTWYSNAVVWANQQGVVRGYGNGLFGTDDPVRMEQMEVILARYTGKEQEWVGDPTKAQAAVRAQVAVALMAALKAETPGPEVTPEPAPEGGRVLVAYFSNTNNTKGVAEKIAACFDHADLYQIVPEVPYTAADLNYNTDCRANREQNDPEARPAISGSVEDWEDYDVVFLGYPIWWGVPPKIMQTFMESYDFGGKTVIPFCTSGSSGYNDRAVQELAGDDVTWLTGRRFSGGAGQEAVESWVDSLGLEF